MFFANHPESSDLIQQKGWSFLTKEEWDYLLSSRTTAAGTAPTVSGKSDARYMKCSVQYIHVTSSGRFSRTTNGLMIFPDIFTWPSDVDRVRPSMNNRSSVQADEPDPGSGPG